MPILFQSSELELTETMLGRSVCVGCLSATFPCSQNRNEMSEQGANISVVTLSFAIPLRLCADPQLLRTDSQPRTTRTCNGKQHLNDLSCYSSNRQTHTQQRNRFSHQMKCRCADAARVQGGSPSDWNVRLLCCFHDFLKSRETFRDATVDIDSEIKCYGFVKQH